jgi:chemotaxis receptor (MCP) glutamine deamidase CheD
MLAQKKNLVGIASVALPDSTKNSMDVEDIPAFFAGTGIPNLLKQFTNFNLGAVVEDVGGDCSRTVWAEVDTCRVYGFAPGKGRWAI